VVIPYEAISEVKTDASGEVEVIAREVEPPYQITDARPSVTFKPKNPRELLDELYRRVEDAKAARTPTSSP
jgi:hypothetical protein